MRPGPLDAVGRVIGFLMIAGPAMAILAGVVLLPSYVALAQAEYDEACAQASVADAKAQIQANERLIAALPTDPVLTKRLAENQLPCRPQHEVIIPGAPQKRPPDLVLPRRAQRPSRPPRWLMTAAGKMSNPPTRRGLLLLALGALITAVYLFAPPQWPSRRR
ncbi:MAG: hypothetical protein ISS78_03040 [Phycisphaerae bacterium]|nr:hypothetical protein [Phycisphaerae bacterium]